MSAATPGSVNMQPIPDFQSIVGQTLGAAQIRSSMNLQDSQAELVKLLGELGLKGAGVSEIFFKWAGNQQLVNDRIKAFANNIA